MCKFAVVSIFLVGGAFGLSSSKYEKSIQAPPASDHQETIGEALDKFVHGNQAPKTEQDKFDAQFQPQPAQAAPVPAQPQMPQIHAPETVGELLNFNPLKQEPQKAQWEIDRDRKMEQEKRRAWAYTLPVGRKEQEQIAGAMSNPDAAIHYAVDPKLEEAKWQIEDGKKKVEEAKPVVASTIDNLGKTLGGLISNIPLPKLR